MRSIEKWEEISEVSFAEDENKNSIAVYMCLWGGLFFFVEPLEAGHPGDRGQQGVRVDDGHFP